MIPPDKHPHRGGRGGRRRTVEVRPGVRGARVSHQPDEDRIEQHARRRDRHDQPATHPGQQDVHPPQGVTLVSARGLDPVDEPHGCTDQQHDEAAEDRAAVPGDQRSLIEAEQRAQRSSEDADEPRHRGRQADQRPGQMVDAGVPGRGHPAGDPPVRRPQPAPDDDRGGRAAGVVAEADHPLEQPGEPGHRERQRGQRRRRHIQRPPQGPVLAGACREPPARPQGHADEHGNPDNREGEVTRQPRVVTGQPDPPVEQPPHQAGQADAHDDEQPVEQHVLEESPHRVHLGRPGPRRSRRRPSHDHDDEYHQRDPDRQTDNHVNPPCRTGTSARATR